MGRFFAPVRPGSPPAPEKVLALRAEVLRHLYAPREDSDAAVIAYKRLFYYLGLAGVRTLTGDPDLSIASQAAWETRRKAVKRDPPVDGRAGWVFDRREAGKFVTFFAQRLGAEPPAWWRDTLVRGEVFPGRHHAFDVVGAGLPSPAKAEARGGGVVVTSAGRSVRVEGEPWQRGVGMTPPRLDASPEAVALFSPDACFIAVPGAPAYPFDVFAVDPRTGRRKWSSLVWAVRRGPFAGSPGPCPVEIRRHRDTVIVYGAESHGMYAEGFDAATGRCRFRFCSCFWFHHPERWGLR